MYRKGYLLFLLCFSLTSLKLSAQDEDIFGISKKARNPKSNSSLGNAFRSVQELFSFQLSTGAGYYQMSTAFYSGNNQVYPISQYQNHDYSYFPLPDTLSLRSQELILPRIEAGLRLNLFNILTLGGGYGVEQGRHGPFEGSGYSFSLAGNSYQLGSYYASAGLILYDAGRRKMLLKMKYKKYDSKNQFMQRQLAQRLRQNYPWRISVEAEAGKMQVRSQPVAVPRAYQPHLLANQKNYYYGAGLRVDYDLSEYATLFVKGELELRSFVNGSADFAAFPMDQQVFGLQAGLSMKVPGTKKCKINGCGVVMKHLHDGVEYRGSSIFNLQNRKIGQWY
jgi:hypothetical protein